MSLLSRLCTNNSDVHTVVIAEISVLWEKNLTAAKNDSTFGNVINVNSIYKVKHGRPFLRINRLFQPTFFFAR